MSADFSVLIRTSQKLQTHSGTQVGSTVLGETMLRKDGTAEVGNANGDQGGSVLQGV